MNEIQILKVRIQNPKSKINVEILYTITYITAHTTAHTTIVKIAKYPEKAQQHFVFFLSLAIIFMVMSLSPFLPKHLSDLQDELFITNPPGGGGGNCQRGVGAV